MATNGLNNKDLTTFEELKTKAHTLQLKAMVTSLTNEIKNREMMQDITLRD